MPCSGAHAPAGSLPACQNTSIGCHRNYGDTITSVTTCGFSNQEELTIAPLVHLNGRIYDTLLARMMSADPPVLAAARLRLIAGTAWSTKRYLNIALLTDQKMRGAITA